MKITFVFNNCNWTTIDQKVKNICAFFAPSVTLEPTILQSSFSNIQFETVNTINGIGNTPGTATTVAKSWYDFNILPLTIGAEIIVFCISEADVLGHPLCPTGIRGDDNNGPVECVIFGMNENYRCYVNATDIGNSFEIFAAHEISHALYLIGNKNDNTHLYFYTGAPAKVLPDLKGVSYDPKLFLTRLINYLTARLGVLRNQQSTMTSQPPVGTPTQPEVLLWDKINARHSIRVLCDRAGLSLLATINIKGKLYTPKDVICACIRQESQFDNSAKFENKDKVGRVWSTDWGICQINDYFHVTQFHDFPSVQYILDNPDKAVNFMIQCYKDGRLNQWVSYSSGAYEQWL